ncbi:PBP1A family penicillin-binding protein [Haliangium sp.]|uniref:PBP1A family penicillin-binding protein n=1 Tax=Haliangium sp. TaxID=2663208 RepID=UPI003D0F7360
MTRYVPRPAHIANRRRCSRPVHLLWKLPLALALWALWAVPVVVGVGALVVVRGYVADLPAVPDLDRWLEDAPQTSYILAADGTVLAELPFRDGPAVGHRRVVRAAELPRALVEAVLAAEDARFFRHRGVDPQAVVRAALANLEAGRVVEGASTITQQVARNLLPERVGDERTLRRKVREAVLAWRIERRYDKARILDVYVNQVFLGANAYGVAAAARAYFAKRPAELDLAETALIAGLAQAPGRADPYKDPAAARARRDQVIERMVRLGFVSTADGARAKARAIELTPPVEAYGALAPWYTERARREVEQAAPEAYRRGGLIIETAAQPVLAVRAESDARAATQRLASDGAAPQVGALIWDHRTEYVEATVGGRSFADSRFDRATQACRQPGSAFKPVVYAAALEADVITPGTVLRDAPIAVYDSERDVHWKPRSGHAFRGAVLAQDALAASLNPPAIDVLDRIGPGPVVELARRLGITSELAQVRPLALGASCVVPIELAGAFAVFARRGARAEPRFVTRVRRGPRALFDRAAPEDPSLSPARRLDRLSARAAAPAPVALDEATAYLMSDMLSDVVRRGTATAARRLDRPVAGKTGTTNDNTDAWFVGYSGRVVVAVWVGHDDPAQTLGPRQDGAHAALPLWMDLVEAAEAERPPVPVPGPAPAFLEQARVDRDTGLLAGPGVGGAVTLWFKPGTAPTAEVGTVSELPADLGRLTREF